MPELALIFSFVIVALIIVSVGVNALVGKQIRHKEWLEENRASKRGKVSDDKYEALEERVRVLERIATDDNKALAHQIDQLRDLQDADTRIERKDTA